MLKNFFSSMHYVKVYKNKMVIKNLANDSSPQMFMPDVAFTTTRLLVGTYAPAAQCLKQAINKSTPNHWLKVRTSLLIQPMEMIEGGLSEVEDRILRECGLSAGARNVVIWIGAELTNDKAIQKIAHSR